jgi:hypothetical protein
MRSESSGKATCASAILEATGVGVSDKPVCYLVIKPDAILAKGLGARALRDVFAGARNA